MPDSIRPDVRRAYDERTQPTRPLELTRNEARFIYEEIRDECDRCSDGGSIPPQHWRTAVNKLQEFAKGDWPDA
jgi:hypothetical protein